jgi:hypothetical protein
MKKNEFKLAGMTWEIIDTDMPDLGVSNPESCKILLNSRLKGQDREVTYYMKLFMLSCLRWVSVTMTSVS